MNRRLLLVAGATAVLAACATHRWTVQLVGGLLLPADAEQLQVACHHDWTTFLQATWMRTSLLNALDSAKYQWVPGGGGHGLPGPVPMPARPPERVRGVPTGILKGPGVLQDVPLFHDCQRFVIGATATNLKYDSLFAIFATSRVHELGNLGTTNAIPAAQILAWNDYAFLNIKSGHNCLFMYKDGGGLEKGKMVNFGPDEGDCVANRSASSLTGPELAIAKSSFTGAGAPDYPKVARWGWDKTNLKQFIGLRCGVAWCEVGLTQPSKTYQVEMTENAATLTGAEAIAAVSALTAMPATTKRIYDVQGWYDEQILAKYSSPPTPSGIIAKVFPSDDIQTASGTVGPFTDTWVLAAEVALDVPTGVANPYDAKLNLEGTTPGGNLNQIWFCYRDSACPGMATDPICSNEYKAVAGGEAYKWWAKIVSSDNSPTNPDVEYRCVRYYPTPSSLNETDRSNIPRTARWHWLEQDDIIWEWCPAGCCEVWGS